MLSGLQLTTEDVCFCCLDGQHATATAVLGVPCPGPTWANPFQDLPGYTLSMTHLGRSYPGPIWVEPVQDLTGYILSIPRWVQTGYTQLGPGQDTQVGLGRAAYFVWNRIFFSKMSAQFSKARVNLCSSELEVFLPSYKSHTNFRVKNMAYRCDLYASTYSKHCP